MPPSPTRGPLGNIQEKPTAQTAHLVFADTKANAEKTKRAVSSHARKTSENNNQLKIIWVTLTDLLTWWKRKTIEYDR